MDMYETFSVRVLLLVKDKQGNAADVTNYRGITLIVQQYFKSFLNVSRDDGNQA